MNREEHIAKIDEIIKDNQHMKTMLGEQNNLLSAMRDYTKADVDEAYQKGLDDAWDCLCEIARMDADELESIFDIGAYTNPLHGIVNEYTPMRTIETLKGYKEQKNDEIHVGDEISFSDGTTGYVIMPDYNEKDMLVSTSDCACLQLISKKGKGNPFISWEKTGMRNGEIVRMVKDKKEKS